MKHAALVALVAAAAVSADLSLSIHAGVEITHSHSAVYGKELPSYEHYNCDATSKACYDPKGYGNDYKPDGYEYKRQFPYPGPKERFCKKLKKLGKLISGFIHKVFGAFHHTWVHFKRKFTKWCAIAKSDAERFKFWLACEKKKFKDWWGYHQDLCRTRKALWDDAMREYHRQWCHMKKKHKKEYEDKKKACHIKEPDYDDADYDGKPNEYGASPIELSYGPVKDYDQNKYVAHCKTRDDKYTDNGKKKDLGYAPAKGYSVDKPTKPGAGPPVPVNGEAAPAQAAPAQAAPAQAAPAQAAPAQAAPAAPATPAAKS